VGRRGADALGVAFCSPDSRALSALELEFEDAGGRRVDRVVSYFGMRKVETRAGRVYLNGRPFYQRLVLDQGYFPGGLLTAASDDDLRRDIELGGWRLPTWQLRGRGAGTDRPSEARPRPE
jgi:hypothetical protein